jgi:hypothetical protein
VDTSNPRTERRKQAERQRSRKMFFILLALTAGCVSGLLSVIAEVNKSSYTQAHGLSRSGIVTSVTNYDGKGRSSDIGVRLEEPVNGRAVTTVQYDDLTSLKPGAAVRVLVDPKNPGYAEFPGHPTNTKVYGVVLVVLILPCALLFALATAWWGGVWYRQRKSRRSSSSVMKGTDVTS